MPAFVTFGRILFAVLFIFSGATKLFGIQATADFIAAKVVIPALLVPYATAARDHDGNGDPADAGDCGRRVRNHQRIDDRA